MSERPVRTRAYAVDALLSTLPADIMRNPERRRRVCGDVWYVTSNWITTDNPVLAQLQLDRMARELYDLEHIPVGGTYSLD